MTPFPPTHICFQEATPQKNTGSTQWMFPGVFHPSDLDDFSRQAFDALPVLLPQDVSVFSMDLSGSGRWLLALLFFGVDNFLVTKMEKN